ncbi:hypothetical protein BCR42DRAFT_44951 [Absidia repens]|uniref:Uncharacterized protein n=1 Tax=Absidia repens TaxID=90262 RepID=A0A1X2IGG2_9FUNG|nr:hypothetical protein BCR42DRAFT_44951 [Absidia repens]
MINLRMKLDVRKSITEMLFTQETEQRILNSGFYIMRPTLTQQTHLWWIRFIIQDNKLKATQQRAINRIIDDMNFDYQMSKIALLGLTLFPHGRIYFEDNL